MAKIHKKIHKYMKELLNTIESQSQIYLIHLPKCEEEIFNVLRLDFVLVVYFDVKTRCIVLEIYSPLYEASYSFGSKHGQWSPIFLRAVK